MKEYSHTIFKKDGACCDECGRPDKLKVYRVAYAQSTFDSDTFVALCAACQGPSKEEREEEEAQRLEEVK